MTPTVSARQDYHHNYRGELSLLSTLKAMIGLAPTNLVRVQSGINPDYKPDAIRSLLSLRCPAC